MNINSEVAVDRRRERHRAGALHAVREGGRPRRVVGPRPEACSRHAAPIGALPVAADVGREEDIKNLVVATIEHFRRSEVAGPT